MTVPTDRNDEHKGVERPIPRRKTAVALRDTTGDDPNSLAEIMATGRGVLAERIVELAFAHNIPVREDADLAELLTRFEYDTPVPTEAIMAVAEILSYVYKLNARGPALGGVYRGEDLP